MKLSTILFFSFFFLKSLFVVSQEKIIQKLSSIKELTSFTPTTITQDSIGYLWIGTQQNGLIQFDGNRFTNYTLQNRLTSNKIHFLKVKGDSLLIGTDKGLSIRYQHKFTHIKLPKVTVILIEKKNIFLGTSQGVYLLKKNTVTPLKIIYDIDLNYINTVQFDGNNFWIGTKTALWRVNSLTQPKLIKKINNSKYTSLLFYKNSIIAASYTNGIKLIKNGNIVKTISDVKNCNHISLINNKLWIATQKNGITLLDKNTFSFVRNINKYNTNLLKTNNVTTIFKDKQENIWLLSDKLYVYNTSKKINNPRLFFEKIAISNQNLDSISINSYQKILRLKPNQNQLSFTFKTVNINYPKTIQYRWKLTDTFSNWTANNTVYFANLKAGNYQFTVQSKNRNTESKPISFSFIVATPIYQKGWFQITIILIFLSLLAFFINRYVQQLQKKSQQKITKIQLENQLLSLEQKALQLQMNPHFVFNVLNSIKALGNLGKTNELNNTISKFATLLRGVLQNARQEEITLSEEINTLKNYIELEQQIHATPFKYKFQLDLNTLAADEILIPPMLVQPFVENSIKHGFLNKKTEGKLIIKFAIKNQFLHCTIQDNGVGLHQSKKINTHTSIALKVTQKRIEHLSGSNSYIAKEITINNTVKGTEIWFKIPLKIDF